jgi:rhamnose transport system permease protein
MKSVSQSSRELQLTPPWRERYFPNNEVLLLVIVLEYLIFSITGNNFLSAANAFEITRLSVEMRCWRWYHANHYHGGIGLSVGSMIGLSAVVLGGLWRDAHLPIAVAAALTLVVGIGGGALNALMISRLKFPPLIVTLGTFSLFRGIAEGLTRGIENYSGFPARFLFLGQGYVGGLVPATLS